MAKSEKRRVRFYADISEAEYQALHQSSDGTDQSQELIDITDVIRNEIAAMGNQPLGPVILDADGKMPVSEIPNIDFVTRFNGRAGEVSPQVGDYTKTLVGLANVDNTADLDKPLSNAVSAALNAKATFADVTNAINNILGGAGPAVDTLGELATLLANDETAIGALITQMGTKVDKVTGKGLSTEDYTTADKDKLAAISNSATITAIAANGGAIVTAINAANGTQVSSTKRAEMNMSVGLSSTVNIASVTSATSQVIAEICATNSAVGTDWQYAGEAKLSQTVSLAIALGLTQADTRQIKFGVPAGWFYRLRGVGSGTHAETFVGGQQTVFG